MNLKIFTENIEGQALNQVYTLAKLPAFAESKIRIMPDVHAGSGCVIGFTGNLGSKVIPNIVGVDIGCGMLTIELADTNINLEELDDVIHKFVPSGHNIHEKALSEFEYNKLYCIKNLKNTDIINPSIGTLGGGNHFIEIDKDSDGKSYLIIHTGSRNLGKQVAEFYQKLAEKEFSVQTQMQTTINEKIAALKTAHQEQLISSEIEKIKKSFHAEVKVPKELSWLEGKNRDDYLHDMKLCQEYAIQNRAMIAKIILSHTNLQEISRFETIHNYIDEFDIVRKGAIAAHKGQKVLIPLNMRDGCIVGIGKGNEDWNESGPHGAGRVLSRSQAKAQLSLAEYEEKMKDIYTTCVNTSTLDESPMAYKPSAEIIDLVKDTIDITKIIKPIYNFKASE